MRKSGRGQRIAVTFHRLAKGPLREGPATTSPRSRSEKNVTDAKLEKTSLSADVFLGVPFVTGPPCATLAGVGVNSNPQARYGKKNSFSYYTNRTFSCIMKWLGQDICLSHRKET